MDLVARPHLGIQKPNLPGLSYDDSYWGRLGVSEPLFFAPVLGSVARDLSPNENSITLNSGLSVSSLPPFGPTLLFASTNSGCTLGSTVSLGTTHTIAFSYYNTNTSGFHFVQVIASGVSNNLIQVRELGGSQASYIPANGANASFASGYPTLATSTWYMFVFTRNNTNTVTHYLFSLTGALLYSGTASVTANSPFSFTGIGNGATAINGNVGSVLAIPVPLTFQQSSVYARRPWAMFGRRDIGFAPAAAAPATPPFVMDDQLRGGFGSNFFQPY